MIDASLDISSFFLRDGAAVLLYFIFRYILFTVFLVAHLVGLEEICKLLFSWLGFLVPWGVGSL